ncbi:MAG: FadR/GntR family transcriptional regulator [Candidatus Sulfotelmatobacter sp.]
MNPKKKRPAVNPLSKSFLTPMLRSTLTADICRKMVSHLIRGDWSEGERIPPERELCRQLGVGRASLREALKALEIMGMIEIRLGDGTFVCRRSEFLSRPLLWAITGSVASEAQELVEARRLIEVELVGLAAERSTAEDLKEVGNYLDLMEANRNDRTAFQEADINFHLAVGKAAHNRILQNALQLIRNLMQEWIGETLMQQGVADEALEHHKQIFLALAKRNPDRARAGMRLHLDMMAQHLQRERAPMVTSKVLLTGETSSQAVEG